MQLTWFKHIYHPGPSQTLQRKSSLTSFEVNVSVLLPNVHREMTMKTTRDAVGWGPFVTHATYAKLCTICWTYCITENVYYTTLY